MTILTYDVEFDPLGTPIDITDNVERVEWTEIGTGEIRSALIRLNSQFGQFITNDTSGATPILDEFDQIKLTVTDRNNVSFTTIFEVDILRPINDTQQGTVLEVELLGREYHLTKVNFAKPFFFENAFTVVRDIFDFYNDPDSKGTLQPSISGGDVATNNTLPQWSSNDFRFDLSEQAVYDGILEVVDRMGSSVASGGGGDFWEMKFLDSAGSNILFPQIYISGNPPNQQTNGVFDFTKAITITDTLSVNPAEEEGGIESTRGTVVGTWGADNFGSLPVQFMEWNGASEAFAFFPLYDSTLTYPTDSITATDELNVDGDLKHWKALVTVPPATPPVEGANWTEITFQNYLTSFSIDPVYSLWTNNQVNAWRVSGSNPAGTIAGNSPTFDTAGCWDSNLIIVDEDGYRTQAEIRAIATADIANGVPAAYKYGGTDLYRGFRILVDVINMGATGAPFNQNGGVDKFGNSYDNNVVQHNGGQFTGAEEWKNWDVFRVITNENMVAIDNEGRVYQQQLQSSVTGLIAWDAANVFYQPPNRVQFLGAAYEATLAHYSNVGIEPNVATGAWRLIPTTNILTDISDSNSLANDCYHSYFDIQQVDGYISRSNTGSIPDNFGTDSAVRYTWFFESTDYAGFLDWLNVVINKPKYYRVGAWADFKFPFPHNSFQGDTVGQLYGNNSTKREPVTLDTTNMHFNHNGGIGFNNVDARDLGSLENLVTFQKFRYKAGSNDADETLIANGNFQFRCTCYDTSDNVVTQDFTIAFNNQWTAVVLPLSQFQIYRARTPAKWAAVLKPFLKDREILNVFEWKNLKKISFQWLKPYDEQGRYDPNFFDPIKEFLLVDGAGFSSGRIDWSFDGFYFSKNDLAITPPDTDRSLQPRFFDEPLISNHIQLEQSNSAKLEITSFRHKEYQIGTEGSFDINFADSFFLENQFLVNESDKPDGGGGFVPNTIKLVAKKIVYTIDKQPQGAGGFLRTITGVKRFE